MRRRSALLSAYGLSSMERTDTDESIVFTTVLITTTAPFILLGALMVLSELNDRKTLRNFDHSSIEQQFQSVKTGIVSLDCKDPSNTFPLTLEDYRDSKANCKRFIYHAPSANHTMDAD